MRNFLLLAFVLVVTAVVSLDHYTLNKYVEFEEAAEQYYTNALIQVYQVAQDLDAAYGQQLDVRRMQHAKDTLDAEHSQYFNRLTEVLYAQQEEAKRLNGIIDDLSNKLHEQCQTSGQYRVKCIELYQYAQIACEYINKCNAVLKANNLPLPEVTYDGERLFDEEVKPAEENTNEDKNT